MLRSSDRREIAELINAALRRLGERISNRVDAGMMSDYIKAGDLAELLGESGGDAVQCGICGAGCESASDAIAGGWIASYFVGDDESGAPACPKCAKTRLRQSEDGELELIQDGPAGAAIIEAATPNASEIPSVAGCDWGDGMNDATGDAADLARLETADSALGRAARALYMLGSPAAVRLGEAIEPILGKVKEMLRASSVQAAAAARDSARNEKAKPYIEKLSAMLAGGGEIGTPASDVELPS